MALHDILMDRIEWLSQFSADEQGGLSRLLYAPDWLKTQELIRGDMAKKGFATRYDSVGNLFVRLNGTEDKTVLIGSHIDTVRSGGRLDGQYGVMAGLMALEELRSRFGQPRLNVEVVSMAEEEGSRFPYAFWGSKNIIGKPERCDIRHLQDADGVYFVDAMREAGFDFQPDDATPRRDLHAYLEWHIEQGGVLERENKSVGVVTAIVGQKRFTIDVTGEANHAGTTPMPYRKDALAAASGMIWAVRQYALAGGDPLVATVGKIEVVPNTSNVVPGAVHFTLDIRHTSATALADAEHGILQEIRRVAAACGVDVSIQRYMNESPVPMDAHLIDALEQYLARSDFNYRIMHSGAGHDAQIFAPHVPSVMLFVPSIGGISHNPAEATKPEDLAVGLKALIGFVHELAY